LSPFFRTAALSTLAPAAFTALVCWLAVNSATSDSSMSRIPISSIIISSESSLSGLTTSSGSLWFSSSYVRYPRVLPMSINTFTRMITSSGDPLPISGLSMLVDIPIT
jgi:hypothetical protein